MSLYCTAKRNNNCGEAATTIIHYSLFIIHFSVCIVLSNRLYISSDTPAARKSAVS